MPVIAIVDGIRITMYWDDHTPPHFHAWVGSRDAMFDLRSGKIIAGQLDRRSIRKVEAWAEQNQEVLNSAWLKCQTGSKGTTKS